MLGGIKMRINYSTGSTFAQKELNGLKMELNISNENDVLNEIERLKKNKIKSHKIITEKTIEILDKCARMWLDEEYSKEHINMLAQITNQSVPLITYELNGSMEMLLKENIEKTIKEELGDLDILDTWVKRSYGYAHRQPRGLIFHNISGNALVVILMSIAMGLLSKNCNLVKVSGDEPYFAYAFYKSLCEIDDSIKDRLSIIYFDSSNENIYDAIVKNSDSIIHWGGESSSKKISSICAKYQKHLIMHGQKISFEVLDSLDDSIEIANNVAKDIICWEQKACLSPRIVFINKKNDVNKFAKVLGESLKEIGSSIPKAYSTAWNSIKTIQDRQYCEIKYGMKENDTKIYSSYNADYTVILSKDMPDKEDINRCFYRFIFVCPYDSEDEVYEYVSENLKEYLQTMGYAGDDIGFIEKMTLLGVSIVTKPGYMAIHYPGTSHDGNHNLYDMTLLVSRQI